MLLPEKNDIYKVQIEFDEKKIIKESEFSIEELQYAVVKSCKKIGVNYKKPYLICKQYESIFAILGSFLSKDWIGPYIKNMFLYYPDGNIEDLLND